MRRAIALVLTLALCTTGALRADTLRIAFYDTELGRRGPGLLLADILKGDEQVAAVVEVIAHAAPDILLLGGFDHDLEGHALAAFSRALADAGMLYPHLFAPPPNAGLPTGLDMDGNGKLGEARDSQGYGAFTGARGLALLSRFPLGEARDFSPFLWADLPGAIAPTKDGTPFPSPEAHAAQRLSSVAHWDVPVITPDATLHLLAFSATTPVFDGPEDLNGRRNHDEIIFWLRFLEGGLPFPPPDGSVVVIGNANLDPVDGQGRHEAITALLQSSLLQDPQPASPGAELAATPGQRGDPRLDTVDWPDPKPGNLRVDYVLPDAGLKVAGAGVVWPAPDDSFAATVQTASRHRLVWVDLAF
ncbi:MAG TPA: endonuclease/exonuclease/phosphatase family protein [Rhodobacterales bacterium]|nr:endonuclease/exonuclease/phosphatase family protein [Rhodobacterales bacterium]